MGFRKDTPSATCIRFVFAVSFFFSSTFHAFRLFAISGSFWQEETVLALNLLDLDVTPGNIVALTVEMPTKMPQCYYNHGAKSIFLIKEFINLIILLIRFNKLPYHPYMLSCHLFQYVRNSMVECNLFRPFWVLLVTE